MVVEPARSTGHVSRVAITNSREDLTSPSARSRSPDLPIPKNLSSGLHKKSVTKINIGAGLGPDALVAEVDEHSRSESVGNQRPPSNNDDVQQQTHKPETSQHHLANKSVENNNVITKSKGRSVSTSSGGVDYEPANPLGGSQHALVDKRNSTSSSTTTSVSKTSSANLSGSYHHLHHLSQVIIFLITI